MENQGEGRGEDQEQLPRLVSKMCEGLSAREKWAFLRYWREQLDSRQGTDALTLLASFRQFIVFKRVGKRSQRAKGFARDRGKR